MAVSVCGRIGLCTLLVADLRLAVHSVLHRGGLTRCELHSATSLRGEPTVSAAAAAGTAGEARGCTATGGAAAIGRGARRCGGRQRTSGRPRLRAAAPAGTARAAAAACGRARPPGSWPRLRRPLCAPAVASVRLHQPCPKVSRGSHGVCGAPAHRLASPSSATQPQVCGPCSFQPTSLHFLTFRHDALCKLRCGGGSIKCGLPRTCPCWQTDGLALSLPLSAPFCCGVCTRKHGQGAQGCRQV